LGPRCQTGADVTGSFSGKGKATCWDEFDNASTPILQALANLGCGNSGVEQLACRMYQPKTDIKTVKALRWSLFKKNQAESERLPPTEAALHQAILRAHYQLLVWNNDHVANPVLSSPEGYGWQDEDGKWVPVMTNLPPAPEAINYTACPMQVRQVPLLSQPLSVSKMRTCLY